MMAHEGLDLPTPGQAMVLRFVAAAELAHAPASVREIATFMGVKSTNAISGTRGGFLFALAKKGYVTLPVGFRSRGYRVTEAGWSYLDLKPCPKCGGRGRL